MKKKQSVIILIAFVIVLILGFLIISRGFNGGEDNWIKDSKGIWIKHGNPSSTPDYVELQQEAISCAMFLYNKARNSGMQFNSQCLGRCMDYSVDVVNIPRTEDDNKPVNQCDDYKSGVTKHFIELDKNGNTVRIVE